jgi:hypothetical protein
MSHVTKSGNRPAAQDVSNLTFDDKFLLDSKSKSYLSNFGIVFELEKLNSKLQHSALHYITIKSCIHRQSKQL